MARRMLHMNRSHELRYQSLFNPGRALSFPCDAEGHVQLDLLGDRAMANYLYARVVVGREYGLPRVSVLPVD
jgi:hypothetical protein